MADRPVVAVIGGGVSGLAAARILAGRPGVSGTSPSGAGAGPCRRGAARVVVFEASERFGGKVQTGEIAGVPVELGPDQFLRRDPSAERLCRHLGLGDALVAPAVRGAAVYSRGAMRALPTGLVLGVPTDLDAVAASGIVSAIGVERARGDLVLDGPPLTASDVGLAEEGHHRGGDERSAGEILRARLGDEVVDRLVDPLLGGINAGGVDHMSLGVSAPQVASALVGHRQVIEPLAATIRAGGGAGGRSGAGPLFHAVAPLGGGVGGGGEGSPFLGLRGGLGQMIAGCLDELVGAGVELRAGTAVRAIRPGEAGSPPGAEGARYLLETTDGPLACDAVVLAVPAYVAAHLLAELAPKASGELGQLAYASVAVLTLAYPAGSLPLPRAWTGVLVPRVEGHLMTAATFLGVKWPWMASASSDVVRVSAGRFGDERTGAMADDDLACELAGEVERIAAFESHPSEWRLTRWERSFPQYQPGHRGRIEAVRRDLAPLAGIEIAGALLGGIGIPACLTSGEAAAKRLAAGLRSSS